MPLIGSDKPRRHAYEFAHRALFALAARDAGRFDGLAEAGKLDDALAWLWHDVGSRLTDEERVADVLFTAARYQDGAR